MKRPFPPFLFALSLWLLAVTHPFAAAQEDIGEVLRPALVSSEMLEAKIAEADAAELPDETKTKLVELYRKALSNLQEANANAERTSAFENATRTAPAQTQLIREKIEEAEGSDPLATLGVTLESPLEQIELLLQKEQADLAAVTARRAEFDRRLAGGKDRPTVIRQRLGEAALQQEENAAELRVQPDAGENPALAQARRWVLQTRNAALSTEIKMLNRELISQGIRLDLLEAKRAQKSDSVSWIGARVQVLSELVNRKRQREAEKEKAEVEEMRLKTAGSDPLLVRLADRNAELTDDLDAMATRLDQLRRERAQAEKRATRIQADYEDAQSALESSGRTEGLGEVLVAHRNSLPDARIYVDKAQALEQEIDDAVVRRLRHREEARRTDDIDETFALLEAQLGSDKRPLLREQLRHLVERRHELLEKALKDDEFYLARLRELAAAEHKLLTAVRAYDNLLSEHLLWLGSVDPTRLEDFGKLPGEARILLSPTIWSGLVRALLDQVAQSPTAWFALLSIAVLFWRRRALIAAIEATSRLVGNPVTDRFSHTLRVLALTLVAAAPLSLLFVAVGWQLQAAAQGSDLYSAVGFSLFRAAMHLYVLRALRVMCIPRGLAAAHFRWKESSLRLLRVELDRLAWIVVPAVLVLRFAIDLNPMETGGMIARLGLLVGLGSLALFFYRLLHPKRGVLAHWRLREKPGLFAGTYKLWYAVLVALPLALATLPLMGYLYSVFTLSFMYLYTLWTIGALVLARALALRWLRLVRRRLTYEAAMERRDAELEEQQAGESQVGEDAGGVLHPEEPEVDLEALSDDSRELVNIATIAGGLVLLYLIWSPLLPALRIFDEINLWYQTVTVDGEDVRVPITLASLGLAFLYTIGIGILAKRLPALLEIILLRRFDVSAGSRYAVVTLTNYAIIVIGVLLVVNTIGAEWSQLQWLVAALGVGIGFGLQEIVANFISGLIILFERPIRVGDMVTVGDTDGEVTKIRIRATTIRNFDRKELLVPNKEFITGRLLNWSLSDQVVRIVIVVGVAYGTDVEKALELMRDAAEENEKVIDDPKSVVSFEGFGDNSLTLLLRAYIDDLDCRVPTITALHKAINRKFEEAGITIAFPQRDLHLDMNGPLRVSIEDSRKEKPEGGGAG